MDYHLSDHARQRCAEMGISTKRVKRVLRFPEIDSPSAPKYRKPGSIPRVATGDGLVVVYNPCNQTVITVLWDAPKLEVGLTREQIEEVLT